MGSHAIPVPACRPRRAARIAGLIEKIPYLQDLGITAVELLPVFQFDEQDCSVRHGQLLGLQHRFRFSPRISDTARARIRSGPIDEFRDMVKALHRAGIEVILDVVFNHTAEGDHDWAHAVAFAGSTIKPITSSKNDRLTVRQLLRLREHA